MLFIVTVAKMFVRLFVWWYLTPLTTIFQLYHGGQFYWWRKPEEPEKTTVGKHWQTLSHNGVHLALIEIRTHNISSDKHWLHRYLLIQLPYDHGHDGTSAKLTDWMPFKFKVRSFSYIHDRNKKCLKIPTSHKLKKERQ